MTVDDYLAQAYPSPPCWALVADYYTRELAQPVTAFRVINNNVRALARAFRLAIHANPDGFEQLAAPAQHCLVLMATLATVGVHHCGVYVDGKVLHALETGAVHQDLASLGDAYQLIEYWGLA